jgi:hypothetical protein
VIDQVALQGIALCAHTLQGFADSTSLGIMLHQAAHLVVVAQASVRCLQMLVLRGVTLFRSVGHLLGEHLLGLGS